MLGAILVIPQRSRSKRVRCQCGDGRNKVRIFDGKPEKLSEPNNVLIR